MTWKASLSLLKFPLSWGLGAFPPVPQSSWAQVILPKWLCSTKVLSLFRWFWPIPYLHDRLGSWFVLKIEPCILSNNVPVTCAVHSFSLSNFTSAPQDGSSHFFFQFSIRVLPMIYFSFFFLTIIFLSPVAPAHSSTLVPLSSQASEYCFLHPCPCRWLPTYQAHLSEVICFTRW